jgi:hypothetical protein
MNLLLHTLFIDRDYDATMELTQSRVRAYAAVPFILVLATACGGGSGAGYGPSTAPVTSAIRSEADAASSPQAVDMTSLLQGLKKQVVIGTLVDPKNGAGNPYGLTVVPFTSGKLTAGDLLVCNFNAKSGVQGTGTSIVAIHPKPGAKPIHVSADKTLLGCNAIAIGNDDYIWAASMVANDNPVLDTSGNLFQNIKGKPFNQPWGQVFAQPKNAPPAYYATNAGNGSIVRINLGAKFTYDVIATKFPVNHGVPGTALAPSGLAYDASVDTLYFANGKNNTIVAFENVSKIKAGGIVAGKGGTAFTGASAKSARIVFSGKPLNGPISTALLPNHNLIVGNTLDPDGTNLMLEITPNGKLLATRNVDKGPAGALFGIVATGTTDATTKIYFNDDNDNNLQVLQK